MEAQANTTDPNTTPTSLGDVECSSLKLVQKIDWRILPTMFTLYITALLDRTNIGIALVHGLIEHLKLNSTEESLTYTLFMLTHILMELPSVMLLKVSKPKSYFCGMAILWSLICILQAFVNNFGLLAICRIVLGAAEAGFAPGLIVYLSMWYTREEVRSRILVSFMAIPFSGIIGGPLAAAISLLNFRPETHQTIFLVEGLIFLALAILLYFFFQNFPETCTFLNDTERAAITDKLQNERPHAMKVKTSFSQVVRYIINGETVAFGFINLAAISNITLISVYGPTLIKGFGHDPLKATLLSASPCAVGFLSMYIMLLVETSIFECTLTKKSSYFTKLVALTMTTTIFLVLILVTEDKTCKLVFYIMLGLGSYSCLPIAISWMSVNQDSIKKRLVVSPVTIGFGNLGGTLIPYMFTTKHYPNFLLGFIMIISANVAAIVMILCMSSYFKKENQQNEQNIDGTSHGVECGSHCLCKKHTYFQYTL